MQTFKDHLKEIFINASDVFDDKEILRLSIISENDASNLYENLAKKAKDERVKKVLLDISREEKVHAGEFESLLRLVDDEYEEAEFEGEMEVDDLLGDNYENF